MRRETLLSLCVLLSFGALLASCHCPTGEYAAIDTATQNQLLQLELLTTGDGAVGGTAFIPGSACPGYDVSGTSDGTGIALRGEIQEADPDCFPAFDVTATAGPLCANIEGSLVFEGWTKVIEIRMVPGSSPGECA